MVIYMVIYGLLGGHMYNINNANGLLCRELFFVLKFCMVGQCYRYNANLAALLCRKLFCSSDYLLIPIKKVLRVEQ